MHVGIITYQVGHIKTINMIMKMQTKSFKVTVFAFPFVLKNRNEYTFEARPYQIIDFDIKKYCNVQNINYVEMPGWEIEHSSLLDGFTSKPDVYITCIAKIIPKNFISNRTIINVHPGMLPENRGVDSFKWSVINGGTIGVSLHAIDEHIDCGVLLKRIKIPVFPNDSLRELADRAYEIECDLLANFNYYLSKLDDGERMSPLSYLSKQQIPKQNNFNIDQIFKKNINILIKNYEN